MRGQDLLSQVQARDLIDGDSLDDLLGYGHGVGIGMTDCGKTSALRYLATNTRLLSIVWNPEHEPMPGAPCASPEQLHKALRDGHRKVNYTPPEGDEEKVAHFIAIRSVLRSIGEAMRKARGGKEAPPWCVVFLDEVQQIASKSDRTGPVARALKEDRKRGIRYWSWTQEPGEVPHVIFTQSQVFILMEVKAFRVPYLEDYGVPMTVVWDHIQKPYHYAVVVKNHYALCSPLPLA
jgi:hypothetical protein